MGFDHSFTSCLSFNRGAVFLSDVHGSPSVRQTVFARPSCNLSFIFFNSAEFSFYYGRDPFNVWTSFRTYLACTELQVVY